MAFWIDTGTGTPTDPGTTAVIDALRQYATDGGAGVAPSVPGAEWFNMMTDEVLAVLTLAGIAPSKADHGQLAKAIQATAFSAYPVGAPIPWPLAVPPSGFLLMNGQSFNKTTYPKLGLAYPSGVLPDLRGEFIRGWDNWRGVDFGRSLISYQIHQTRAIPMAEGQEASAAPGSMAFAQGILGTRAFPIGRDIRGAETVNAYSTVGDETRPRNIAFNYIVRAA